MKTLDYIGGAEAKGRQMKNFENDAIMPFRTYTKQYQRYYINVLVKN